MQYRCKKKVKGFIVPKYFEGEVITVQEYNDLPPKIKLSFEENYDDETFAEQLERNQKRDDAAKGIYFKFFKFHLFIFLNFKRRNKNGLPKHVVDELTSLFFKK